MPFSAPAGLGAVAPRTLGFTIESFLELQHWRQLPIDATVPLTAVPACPADGTTLRTLCTLIAATGSPRIRVGCCPECGHVSYIDRPTKRWIDAYYLSTWDAHDVENRNDRRARKLATTLPRANTGVGIALSLDVDRSRPICEIGCGYGTNLKHLHDAGFTNVAATEASSHRAETARRLFGFDVVAAPFESDAARDALETRAPFSIIYSHHALEHTYHPEQIIASASRLQAPGDYLIISVPHHPLEPSMSVLLFLPHLQSFTRPSLERLAARFGYELFDDSQTHPKNLNLAFRKTAAPVSPPLAERPFEVAVEKYAEALQLGRRRWFPQRLWWHTRTDRGGQVWMPDVPVLRDRRWRRIAAAEKVEHLRSARVRPLSRRFTTVEESPLEIQFLSGLALLYK